MGHAKVAIKTKGLECFNLLFEVTEAFEESMEAMTESLQSKNAKVSLFFFIRFLIDKLKCSYYTEFLAC